MDKRLQYIAENYNSLKIGVDEPFSFHCTMCGQCCINREDILLSPVDLFRMSKALGLRPEETLEKFCEVYIGQSSRVPIVRLLPEEPNKRCPLLKDNKCVIHKAKPTVCAMFPIGRAVQMNKDGNFFNAVRSNPIDYIFSKPNCGDNSQTHTVREWLGEFGIPVADPYFLKWQSVISHIGRSIQRLEKRNTPHIMDQIWNLIFVVLYLHYDMNTEFYPQFQSSADKLLDMMKDLEEQL